MKKIAGVALAMVLSLCMFGCAAQDHSNEQETQDASEETPTDKELISRYLEAVGTDSLFAVYEKIGSVLDALQANDKERCIDLNKEITDECNRIIDLKDIPKPAERFHGHLIDAASSFRECSTQYTMAILAEDSEKAAEYIDKGTAAMDEAARSMEKATDTLGDLQRQINVEE